MRRAELALLVLAGCMKIYPDPELPDIDVEWYEGDCVDAVGDVTIAVAGVDDTSEQYDLTVACTDVKTTIKDVSRQRFHVTATLLDAAGGVYSTEETDVDLRNGFSQTASFFFGAMNNVHVAWTFDMGATCTSLGVDSVGVRFEQNGQFRFGMSGFCGAGMLSGLGDLGTYDVSARAFRLGGPTVAISQPIPGVTIVPGMRTDVGTIVLTPCGAACP